MRRAIALARKAPAALQASKALMKRASRAQVVETMEAELAVFADRLTSAELHEAVSAFLEKRPPDFSGL